MIFRPEPAAPTKVPLRIQWNDGGCGLVGLHSSSEASDGGGLDCAYFEGLSSVAKAFLCLQLTPSKPYILAVGAIVGVLSLSDACSDTSYRDACTITMCLACSCLTFWIHRGCCMPISNSLSRSRNFSNEN